MSNRIVKYEFRAALMRSFRGYFMHQRTGRVDASARRSRDIGAASSIFFDVRSFDLRSLVPIALDGELL